MIFRWIDQTKQPSWRNWAATIALSMVVSLAAFATLNSGERKAAREAQAIANETASRVMKACGNSALHFSFDWGGYKELDYTTGGFTREEAIKKAGDRANRVGNALIAVCINLGKAEDGRIKEAISHLKEVRMTPQVDEKNFRIDLSRQGEILQARFGAFGVSASEDLMAEVRRQF